MKTQLNHTVRQVLASLTLLLLTSAPAFSQGATVAVLPLGDSITQGVGTQMSYRRALWFDLLDAGYTVDFVGSITNFSGFRPLELRDFDLDHEGHSGWTADELNIELESWLQDYDADIVLLHAGTNDLLGGQGIQSTLDDLGDIIANLRADNPNVQILLARIIPGKTTVAMPFDPESFNLALDGWAPGQSTPESPVTVIDHATDYLPNDYNFDSLHPNEIGEQFMATRWLEGIEAVFTLGNQRPVVEAGSSFQIETTSETVAISGSVSDDGVPSGSTPDHHWRKFAGPGTVSFTDATQLATTASFSEEGSYILRLQAFDSELAGFDDIIVQVGNVDGPAGYWPLNETSGLDAPDAGVAGNDGTLINLDDNNWQAGYFDNGLCLDGLSGQQVLISGATNGLQPASVTVAGWVKPEPTNTVRGWVAGQGDNYGLVVEDSEVAFYYHKGGSNPRWRGINFSGTNVLDGQWHHVAGSFDDSSGIISVYLDGVLLNARFYPDSINYSIGNAFSIGSMQGQRNFNGCLDEIRVYSRALSAEEVEVLAEDEPAPVCAVSLDLVQGQWRQVSLPCDPGTLNSVSAVFGDDLGELDTDWAIYERNALNDEYVRLTGSDTLETGRGYWIKTLQPNQSISVAGAANDVIDFPLEADPGGRYNMVGMPHAFDVCWADVQVIDDDESVLSLGDADPNNACQGENPVAAGCVMSRVAHKQTTGTYADFNGLTPGSEGTLVPWDGFWVQAFKPNIKLRIPTTPGSCGVPARTATEKTRNTFGKAARTSKGKEARSPWFIRLIAESGNKVDSSNVFGQADESVDAYDAFDLAELDPFGSDYLTVVFPHADWGAQSGNYSSDFHAYKNRWDRERWDFEVRSSDPAADVTLRWEGPDAKLDQSVLIDRATNEIVRPASDGSYAFQMKGDSRSFSWYFGTRMRRDPASFLYDTPAQVDTAWRYRPPSDISNAPK